MIRFNELPLCVTALFAPLTALGIFQTWWSPLIAFFGISLPLIWLAGWLVDHTYG